MERRATVVLACLAIVLLMVAVIGIPPVQRTQEARVLATAREMLASGGRQWLVPRLNGEVRLEKPPLAYWLSATGFAIGGVNETAGRAPMALAGCGILLLIFAAARQLFGELSGWLTFAALLGSMMFTRFARLAETDVLATLFISAAIVCIWQARIRPDKESTWFRLSGASIGMALMSKGLPAALVVLFLLALAAVERDWRMLWRWTRSGAPLLAIVIGGWWYVYIAATVESQTFIDELQAGLLGRQHEISFLQYFPDLLAAMLPWSAITVLAIVIACYHWREPPVRFILLWFGSILIPLLATEQRQSHYLLPSLVPLAILTGWLLDSVIRGALPHARLVRALLIGTCVAIVAGAMALPLIAATVRGWTTADDWIVAAALALITLIALRALLRDLARGIARFALAAVLATTLVMQVWAPSLRPDDVRAVAAEIRAVGPGPYRFYGSNASIPLVFYLRQIVPRVESAQALEQLARRQRDLIVIAQSKNDITPPPPPPELVKSAEILSDDQKFEIYRVRAADFRD